MSSHGQLGGDDTVRAQVAQSVHVGLSWARRILFQRHHVIMIVGEIVVAWTETRPRLILIRSFGLK